jgi:hypothetical protein
MDATIGLKTLFLLYKISYKRLFPAKILFCPKASFCNYKNTTLHYNPHFWVINVAKCTCPDISGIINLPSWQNDKRDTRQAQTI